MSSLDDSLSRPEFESIDLDIGVEEADRYVEEAIKGLSVAESEEGWKYRTTDGMLVAIISEHDSGGDGTTELAYRTEPAFEPATRKARTLFEALQPHAVDG